MNKKIISLHEIVDFTVLAGGLVSVIGSYWDIQWHFTIGRDSFFIPPHLLVYLGVSLVLVGSVAGLSVVRGIRARHLHRKLRNAVLAILGSVCAIVLAAPIDNLWHQIFGLDVTVWSPPHILLIAGGFAYGISFIYFERLYLHIAKMEGVRKFTSDEFKLELMCAIVLAGLNLLVAEFEYFELLPLVHAVRSRPEWWYLAIFLLESSFVLAFSKTVSRVPWAATRIATFYFLIRTLLTFLLDGAAPGPILPPLLIIPAIAFDVVIQGEHRVRDASFLRAGVFFALMYYVTQFIYFRKLDLAQFVSVNAGELLAATAGAILVSVFAYRFGKTIVGLATDDRSREALST